ncbi:uncharacterized protein [Venturia canescens]|uniref:uncharacterized protein n=1 Tax=Venturia canescens TaxID=32260 RepID=UPI001C9BF234|nr:uncharacterized protein LOC122419006 [Venturia canescens]
MNTRRKRHRKSATGSYSSVVIKNENDAGQEQNERFRNEYKLENLPPEVLEMIFRLVPLADVSTSIRLVSRRFSTIGTAVLNGAFLAAGTRLDAIMNYIESTKLSKATTDLDLFMWTRAFNVLELIKVQYKMLKAVTWRYTHPPKPTNFNRLSVYAGSLLDELNVILDLARNNPRALSSFSSPASRNDRGEELPLSYEEVITSPVSSPRVVSFVALCKRFMNYFEKVSECKVNRSALVSGCKAIDVLDCLAVGREVTAFRVSSGRVRSSRSLGESSTVSNGEKTRSSRVHSRPIVTMGLRYVLRRAWFTCLQVPSAPDENSWREDQRFMYLRLRRLVGSVNEHYFEKAHFERDLLLRTSSVVAIGDERRRALRLGGPHPPRPPPASTYSGYGVYAGRFFYYGNMNKYAYESKFKDVGGEVSSSDESGQDDEPVDADDDGDEDTENRNVAAASKRGPPAFDLVIKVELRCSSDLAPLAVISSLRTNELDDQESFSTGSESDTLNHRNLRSMQKTTNQYEENSEVYFKMSITCPASAANRLPGSFTWEQRGPVHSRRKRSSQHQRFSN